MSQLEKKIHGNHLLLKMMPGAREEETAQGRGPAGQSCCWRTARAWVPGPPRRARPEPTRLRGEKCQERTVGAGSTSGSTEPAGQLTEWVRGGSLRWGRLGPLPAQNEPGSTLAHPCLTRLPAPASRPSPREGFGVVLGLAQAPLGGEEGRAATRLPPQVRAGGAAEPGLPGLGSERAPAGLGEKLQEQFPDVRGAGVCEAGPCRGDAGGQEEDLPLGVDSLKAQLLLQLRHTHGLAQVLR